MNRTTTVLFGILLAGVAVAAYRANSRATVLPAPPALLSVPAEALDIGTRYENESLAWVVPVRNVSSSAVSVTPMLSSCACQLPDGKAFDLQPGESHDVQMNLDFRGRCAMNAGLFLEPFTADLGGIITDPSRTERWKIHGTIRRAVIIPTKTVDFGRRHLGATIPPRTLTVRTAPDVESLFVSADSDVGVTLTPSSDGHTYALKISPPSGQRVGSHMATLALSPVSKSKEPVPTGTVALQWEILGDVQAEPADLSLGAIPVGGQGTGSVNLVSASGRTFRVTKSSISAENAQAEVVQTTPTTFVIRLTVAENATVERLVTFEVTTADHRTEAVTVLVRAVGVASLKGGE